MAITDPTVDPMAYLEEAMNKKNESTGSDFTSRPFIFAIGDNERALIRPLLNLRQYVLVHKHEAWDNDKQAYIYRNQCAKDLGQECQLCIDVEAMPETTKDEKDLKRKSCATERFVLPVYLHAIKNVATSKQSTYTKDGQEFPKSGPRLLEMKPKTDQILPVLVTAFSLSGDITNRDFTIEQHGTRKDKKYITKPMPDVSSFDPASFDIPEEYLDQRLVFSIYSDACPPKIVGSLEAGLASLENKSNGTIKNAPDF